ncbi:MAG: hypothetical protein NC246_06575, partial [Muribaculaceae bacterium]|nr:hypothetical protein [Muribaculaceae bacterium]
YSCIFLLWILMPYILSVHLGQSSGKHSRCCDVSDRNVFILHHFDAVYSDRIPADGNLLAEYHLQILHCRIGKPVPYG